MKIYKLLFFTFFLVQAFASYAQQTETDALRLSQNFGVGTARATAMGGAFGALGGDFSSLSINPAGIGVYRSSEFTITPSLSMDNSKSVFYGSKYTDNKNRFNLNNLGYVFTHNNGGNKGWVSLSFGFGYNRLADFNRNITISGVNPNTSLLDAFAERANNLTASQSDKINYLYANDPTGAASAFDTYALNFDSTTNKFNSALTGHGQNQFRTINTKGGIGEYDFSFGGNLCNMLYLGATLGIQDVYYENIMDHSEGNFPGNQIESFEYTQNYKVTGTGINFKVGAIFKPFECLRLGVAYHTPTFFNLESEYYTTMYTNFKTVPVDDPSGPGNYTNASDIYTYDFNVRTPTKVIGSAALVLKHFAILSVDYEYVDYTKAHMQSDDDPFTIENNNIANNFRSTYNMKSGIELKFGDFALRGGYGYYGSPYKSNSDYASTSYSGGIGYRGANFFWDLGYVMMQSKPVHTLYAVNNTPETAKITSNSEKYMMTLGFKF